MHSSGLISANVLHWRKKPAFLALPYFAGDADRRVLRPGRSCLSWPLVWLSRPYLGSEWSGLVQGSRASTGSTLSTVARLLMGVFRGRSGRPPPAVLVRGPQGLQKVASGISFSVNLGALVRILAIFSGGRAFCVRHAS